MNVSNERAESLTDMEMEWNTYKLEDTENDPGIRFSLLHRIDQNFKKINL